MDNARHAAPRIRGINTSQRRWALLAFGMTALLCIVVAVPVLRTLAAAGTQTGRSTTAAKPPAPTHTVSAPTPAATAIPPEAMANAAGAVNTPGAANTPGAGNAQSAGSAAEVAYVNSLIAHMSLQEEVGQMIQVSFWGEKRLQPWMLDEIARDHVGSVILYGANIQSVPQTQAWVRAMQARATIPLSIATDLEGGAVNRISAIAPSLPSAGAMQSRNSPAYARQVGKHEGDLLSSMGITMNFAPVVDVQNVPNGVGILSGRTFGTTPGQVTSLAGAYLDGLQANHHVVGSLKHFPGLGTVPVDPHVSLYTVRRSLPDLWKIDWAPYTSLMASGKVDMVMSTHVIVAAVDPARPATLSRAVITGVLRQQMHFNGVVETDAIYMLQSHYPLDQVILQSAQAGNDIISAAYTPAVADMALRVLVNAVQNGTLSKTQVDDSVRRILLLKLHYGLLKLPAR